MKQGFHNHVLSPPTAKIEPAVINGPLYNLRLFLVLIIDKKIYLAMGTADPKDDIRLKFNEFGPPYSSIDLAYPPLRRSTFLW
ncbi:MAG: hypothetical protein LBV23_05265 [Deltaproteobacteria bacterium]|nr:hypothetical protein [Deltaproteobacteria bacterium]